VLLPESLLPWLSSSFGGGDDSIAGIYLVTDLRISSLLDLRKEK
jgi:hypothetical protein